MMPTQQTDTTNHFTTLFEQLPDPVVEFKQDTDSESIIVNTNVAFRDVFSPVESVVGLPLQELIVPADQHDAIAAVDQRTDDNNSNQTVVERATVSSRRKFCYRSIPISDDHGFAIYSEVTEKYHQEQYLDVLHRVLRHNLRNDLTIITGQLERALDMVESDEAHEALESIEETASALTQLCTKAQTIRRITGQPSTLESTPLRETLMPVIEDCRQKFTEATISVDCLDSLTVQADSRLRIAVDSLVDNAVRHNTASCPCVSINTTPLNDDIIELAIADNGPGIPESEQQVITGDTEISSLSHSSGLGLWLVKWLAESYGGSLDIDTPDEAGSVVSLQLARAST